MMNYKEELKLKNGIPIKMELVQATEDDNLSIPRFTEHHTQFKGLLTYNENQFSFSYQCNLKFVEPDIKYVLSALLLDLSSYESCSDEAEFLYTFGYTKSLEQLRVGLRVFEACRKLAESLRTMFSESEIEEILEIVEIAE